LWLDFLKKYNLPQNFQTKPQKIKIEAKFQARISNFILRIFWTIKLDKGRIFEQVLILSN